MTIENTSTEKLKPGSGYPTTEGRRKDVALYNSLIESREEIRVLDIGCKTDELKFPGSVGLDIEAGAGIDVVHNLNDFPYPFEDNFFDLVVANHVYEHIEDLPRTMEEMRRIMKTGGYMIVRTPFFLHHGAFDDPTHIRPFTLRTMEFFCVNSKHRLTNSSATFKKIHKEIFFGGEAINPGRFVYGLSERYYEKYLQHIFPCSSLFFILQAVDGEEG